MHDERSSELNLTGWWLAFGAFIALAMVAAARIKGGYIDEYYTFSFADSTVPLRHAFDAWTMDRGHPVGFYALSRLGDLVLPADLFVRRLSNLVYLALALIFAWCSGRSQRPFNVLYLATLAAAPYVIERFAEYRSTFLGLMIVAVLVIRLRAALDAPQRGSIGLIALLMAALGLVDYPLAISGVALCGAWGLLAFRDRNWKAVRGAAIAISSCILVIALSLLNEARLHGVPNPFFERFATLIADLVAVAATAVVPCLAMLVLAAVQIRRERVPMRSVAAGSEFTQLLLLSLLFTVIGLVLVNAVTHAVIRRQMFGIIPLIVAYLTALSLPHLRPGPVTAALIGANLIGVSAVSAASLRSKQNFDRYAAEIARAQRSCASLPVYAVLPQQLISRGDNRFHMKDQVAIGLQDVANRDGFGIRLRPPPAEWLDPRCGAILWSEAVWLPAPPTRQYIASKLQLRIDPRLLQSSKLEWADQESRKQYSLLMRVPPPKPL